MNLLTITELSRKTGISSHEIRRRTRIGTLPHMRIGAKQSKILIDEDVFNDLLMKESIKNATVRIPTADDNSDDNVGFDKIRKIG